MKKYIEMILRKIGVSMLVLLIVMTTYFSNSGGSLFLKKVQADTGETTLAMSQAMSSNKIPAIGRAASEGLWAMTAGGHRAVSYTHLNGSGQRLLKRKMKMVN